MLILDGKTVAHSIEESLKPRIENYKKRAGRAPHLMVVLVGEDPASKVYVGNKEKACLRVGMDSSVKRVPSSISESGLQDLLQELNSDPMIDGILVQSPLPQHLSFEDALRNLSPSKDADGLTASNLGKLWRQIPFVKPCTPSGVLKILDHYKLDPLGKKAVVVGRSSIVGRPAAELLLQRDATVTIAHTKTKDLKSVCREADILVVAAGRPELIDDSYIKEGAWVIDVGIHRKSDGKLCGDVDFKKASLKAAALTPVPGGVGPLTVACLLENTVQLAEISYE